MENQYNDEPSFSLNDFRKWMSTQKDEPKKKCSLFGLHVESKIGLTRLIDKIAPEEGEAEELAKEFKRHGGIVIEADEDFNFLIEVDSGSFRIPRMFVKKLK